MAKLEHYHTRFEADCFYHVYNRSINKELLFKRKANYEYFLKRYKFFLSNFVDTYAYCLLGNHFHLLLRIKPLSTLQGLTKVDMAEQDVHKAVSSQFRKLFQSYALAFNKQNGRYGSLFQKPFKRAKVGTDEYLSGLISYIHLNPQKHGLISDFKQWPWSSYRAIISDKETNLVRSQVLDWFGGKKEYVNFHQEDQKVIGKRILIDDD